MDEPPRQSTAPHGKDVEENPAYHDDSMVAPPPVVDGDAALHVGSVDADAQQQPPPQLEQQVGEVHLSAAESAKLRSNARAANAAAAAAASKASTSSARPQKQTPKGRPKWKKSDESDVSSGSRKKTQRRASVASSAEEGEQSEAEDGGSKRSAKRPAASLKARNGVRKAVMMPVKQPLKTYYRAKIPEHMTFVGLYYDCSKSYFAEATSKIKYDCGLSMNELRVGKHITVTYDDGLRYMAEIICFGTTKLECDQLIDVHGARRLTAEKVVTAEMDEDLNDEESEEPMHLEDAREEPEAVPHDDFSMDVGDLFDAKNPAEDGEDSAAEREEQEKNRVAREARREEKRRETEELQRKREERARKEEEKREQRRKKMEEDERKRQAEEGEATRRASNEVAAAAAAATAGPRPAAAARCVQPPAPDFKIPKERMEQQRRGEAAGTSAEQEEQLGSAWVLNAPRPVKRARKSAAKAKEDTVAIKTAAAAAASQQVASAPVVHREQIVARRGEPSRNDVVESQQKLQQLPARGSVSVDPIFDENKVKKEEPFDPEFEALERAAAAAAAAHAAAPAQLMQHPTMMTNARGGGGNWALQQQQIVSRMVLHRQERQPVQLQLQPAPGSQQRAGGGFGTTPRPMPALGHAPFANGPSAATAAAAAWVAPVPWNGRRPVDPRVQRPGLMGAAARPPLPAGRPAALAASAAAYRPAPAAAPAARPFLPAAAAGAAAVPNHSLNGSDSKPTPQPVPPPQHMQHVPQQPQRSMATGSSTTPRPVPPPQHMQHVLQQPQRSMATGSSTTPRPVSPPQHMQHVQQSVAAGSSTTPRPVPPPQHMQHAQQQLLQQLMPKPTPQPVPPPQHMQHAQQQLQQRLAAGPAPVPQLQGPPLPVPPPPPAVMAAVRAHQSGAPTPRPAHLFWNQPQGQQPVHFGQYNGRPQPHQLQPQHANRDEGYSDMDLGSDDE